MTAPGSGNPDGRDDKAAWDAIVADLSGQLDFGDAMRDPSAPVQRIEPEDDPVDPIHEDAELLEASEHEGYVPPEPPPLRAPADVITRFAWAGAIGGPVLLVVSNVASLGSTVTTIAGLASVAGFATLVARMRDERDHDDHGGAVV